MNQYKKQLMTVAILGGMATLSPLLATAQRFALKPYADIGLGNSMSMKSDFPLDSKKSSFDAFGLDFGYTFWQKGGNSLGANIGLGYTISDVKFSTGDLNYSYNAPASADMDGNAYTRHYTVQGMAQKVNLGYIDIPLYFTYGYQFGRRFGVHADLGLKFGFRCNAKLGSVTGEAASYGVYPEYDDLVIDAPWLNDFGATDLSEAKRGKVEATGFCPSLLVGAGLDVYIAGPAWLNVGVRYGYAFSDTFKTRFEGRDFTADSAPVTYTVADGQEVKPLTDYFTSSRLSPLSIHVGLTFKF